MNTPNLEKSYLKYTMDVDYCLILAAGYGTRMGEIGKVIPKLLWPVFDETILEIQIKYVRKYYRPRKIFINVHWQAELFLEFSRKRPDLFCDIEILIEPEILDVGGAVHNLARTVDYNGELLILGGDQFYLLGQRDIKQAMTQFKRRDNLLFAIEVSGSKQYNRLLIEENSKLQGIAPPDSCLPYTYSGMGLVRLDTLVEHPGKSQFFESVAPFKRKPVFVYIPQDNAEYFDFGTTERYLESCFKIAGDLKSRSYTMTRLLLELGVMNSCLSESLPVEHLTFGEFKLDINKNSVVYRDLKSVPKV
jgi:mannose-1-phosphate guanylyltransferase